MHHEWLGLIASGVWACTMIMATTPSGYLGSAAFNRWRMICACIILFTASALTGGFKGFAVQWAGSLILSGLVGLGLGDLALYASLNRLGPRLAQLLFATNAFFAVIFDLIFFNGVITLKRGLGMILICTGIFLALYYSQEKNRKSEISSGSLTIFAAVLCGLFASICQAGGQALAKPVLDQGANPVASSAVRMLTALLWHCSLLLLIPSRTKPLHKINRQVFLMVFINAFLALGVGMTCVLTAVKNGSLGLAAVFSSCAPVLLLPLLWLRTGEKPKMSSWISSLTVLLGTTLIFLEKM